MPKSRQDRPVVGGLAIRERIQQATVVGLDETGIHVEWQWVFQTPQWAYYVIRPSRAAQVLSEVMDEGQPEVWISDAYPAHTTISIKCLTVSVHSVRNCLRPSIVTSPNR